ncbi:unnamed protein product [Bursaphelenchus xylophilus]|uniref:(pine wood nematode) hypothetical protein n=1 Tax=Bursaphelenchus xylophilus TaxID=6326 RepID=A0A1I7SL12_BURXY|nr:unnamed protein product [Bursaphelenchus xylophilus]CAG9129331.1 unnamed protein product [Bursaphelenchus xylophilus]
MCKKYSDPEQLSRAYPNPLAALFAVEREQRLREMQELLSVAIQSSKYIEEIPVTPTADEPWTLAVLKIQYLRRELKEVGYLYIYKYDDYPSKIRAKFDEYFERLDKVGTHLAGIVDYHWVLFNSLIKSCNSVIEMRPRSSLPREDDDEIIHLRSEISWLVVERRACGLITSPWLKQPETFVRAIALQFFQNFKRSVNRIMELRRRQLHNALNFEAA